jgi:hypothetical protein
MVPTRTACMQHVRLKSPKYSDIDMRRQHEMIGGSARGHMHDMTRASPNTGNRAYTIKSVDYLQYLTSERQRGSCLASSQDGVAIMRWRDSSGLAEVVQELNEAGAFVYADKRLVHLSCINRSRCVAIAAARRAANTRHRVVRTRCTVDRLWSRSELAMSTFYANRAA